MFYKPRHLHFTGIGGIGMSGLASICQGLGCTVSGSDLRPSPITERLERLRIRVDMGHSASNVPAEAAALVVTSAVGPSNPEVEEARRRGLPVVLRGELLAELMRGQLAVAIGGSHGKTTTTSMTAAIALAAGLDPTVFVGTLVPFLDAGNARVGAGNIFIAECDESDGSFLELSPAYAVITNIDREHLDHYGSFEAVQEAFLRFANKVSYEGAVIACLDDEFVRAILPRVRRRVLTYGRSEGATLRIVESGVGGEGSEFVLSRAGSRMGHFRLRALGEHNVLNAAAAAAVSLELGVSARHIRAGLESYEGAGRRMEWKGEARGIRVVDDYGHHPTEIRATLEALRLTSPKRLFVLFQPHRFTRTAALMDEFSGAFKAADVVRVLEIYPASEEPIEGVTAQALVARIVAAGHPDCRFAGTLSEAVAGALPELRPGDLVVTLGAGSITQAGGMMMNALRKEAANG
jgi:UDP-N-acetylmuramate--alanine ligase